MSEINIYKKKKKKYLFNYFSFLDTNELEDRKLYQALKSGKLHWEKLKISNTTTTNNFQSRLKHGAINKNDKIYLFGGAASNLITSGNYNDVWKFSQENYFQRISTSSSSFPSPKCNFSMSASMGDKVFVVGGRSSIEQPYSAMQAVFEIHSLSTINDHWHKIQTTGSEPQFPSGCRSIMLSSLELLVVTGLVPTFQNFESMTAEENFQYRTSMQIHILKFNDSSFDLGQWHELAHVQNRRNSLVPPPRIETHLAHLGNDSILMYGGRAISNNLQDAWIMKIIRKPSYSIRWFQVIIENPMVPSLPSHSFPSCVINDLLVFSGVRTSLKKQEIERTRCNNNGNNGEPRKNVQSSSNNSALSATVERNPQLQQQQELRKIFINQDRPLNMNTIGSMSAFAVSSTNHTLQQKIIKISQPSPPSNDPLPKGQRSLQDYPMRIFCLDLSNIMNCNDETLKGKLSVKWLAMRRDGLYPNAPELRAYSTFTKLDNAIVLIGGIKRENNDVIFTQSTNEVYVLCYDKNLV